MSTSPSAPSTHPAQTFIDELQAHRNAKLEPDGIGGTIISINDVRISLETYQDGYVVKDVFLEELYRFLSESQTIVIDIGMNLAVASLYFAQMEHVEHIYGYELFEDTYKEALRNLLLNPVLAMKITAYNRGIWDKTEQREVPYNYQWKASLGLFDRPYYLDESVPFENETVQLVDARTILHDIRKKHPNNPIIVKLDCEGSEYNILEAWKQAKLLSSIAAFIIEWHRVEQHSKNDLISMLEAEQFICQTKADTAEFGMLYALKATYRDKIHFSSLDDIDDSDGNQGN